MAATFSTLRPRGVPFQPKRPKTPGSGRRKGVQNVMTRSVREGIAEAARRLGDVARLVEWAMEDPINERIFWSQIWVRLIPLTIHGGGPRGEIEHSLTLTTRADVLKALQERNLPPMVFGYDRPLLDVTPQIEAPGRAVTETHAAVTNGADHRAAANAAERLSED